jgi:hypothetical protein
LYQYLRRITCDAQFLSNSDKGFISIGCVRGSALRLFYSAAMEIKDRIVIVRLAMLRKRRMAHAPFAITALLVRARRYARPSEGLMRR